MKKIKETEYVTGIARVRAREKFLISNQKFIQMIDAKTDDEIIRILNEAGYHITKLSEYENVLQKSEDELADFIRAIVPNPTVFDIFALKSDYHNIKVLLKAEAQGENYDSLLTAGGMTEKEKMKKYLADNDYRYMSEIMSEAIKDARSILSRTDDSQLSDIALDRAMYADMTEMAKDVGDTFVIKLIRMYIDIINIKIYVRAVSMNKAEAFLKKSLIDGGNINTSKLLNFFEKGMEGFEPMLKSTGYGKIAESGNNVREIEKQCDNFILDYIKESKYTAFGISPIIAYKTAKETEHMLIRIVVLGRLRGILADKIKERLRDSYV